MGAREIFEKALQETAWLKGYLERERKGAGPQTALPASKVDDYREVLDWARDQGEL